MTINKTTEELEIAQAFPDVNCPVVPLGNRVLVQIRLPKQKTSSGLILTADSTDDIYRNEQTAVVRKKGATAFTFPSTGEKWREGDWVEAGEYVRVPLHGGDNHWIPVGEGNDQVLVLFKTFKDYELIGKIEGNPLEVKTNLAYF